MTWTTSKDIKKKMLRFWESGRWPTATLKQEMLFPYTLALTHPNAAELSQQFELAREWIRELEEGSKLARGFGYDLVVTEINHRQIGKNQFPTSVVFADESEALAFIGKAQEAETLHRLAALTEEKIPGLLSWVAAKPMRLMEQAEKWERVLNVLLWMRAHPRPNIYLRQMDIAGVDTKFMESCKGLLSELLLSLAWFQGPGEGVASIPGNSFVSNSFEDKFGFLPKPALIRFRILDARLHLLGLSDISAPVSEVARLSLPIRRVFITENDINGLAFPAMDHSLVIFGLGYGVDMLSAIPWLHPLEIFYWGDIDTHGFVILDRLRSIFPHSQSLFMDRETLLQHRDFWGEEKSPAKVALSRLTLAENAVYEDLKSDKIRPGLRLEQERISFGWVQHYLKSVCP
jgi:hypothetical protein